MTILYNASTSAGLANYTRFLTNTNTTTYAANDLYASMNMWYHTAVNEILQSMDDWDFQGEYATANLVASQQEYTLPTDILKIKKVEVSYDGSNWYVASPIDVSETGSTSTTDIDNNFSETQPFFELHDNSLFLYPIPDTNRTACLKVWYEKEITELSGATDEPNLPEAYQKILCYGAAKDYFEKYSEREGYTNKRNIMQQNYNDMLEKMKEFFNTRNQEREYFVLGNNTDYDYDPNK